MATLSLANFLLCFVLVLSTQGNDSSLDEMLNEVQLGWTTYMDGMQDFKKIRYVNTNSLGETAEVISHDGNNTLIFRAEMMVVGMNPAYVFQILRKGLEMPYELQGLVIQPDNSSATRESPQLPDAIALGLSREMFKSGMLLFPYEIPLSMVDFREDDWGDVKIESVTGQPGLYLLKFLNSNKPDKLFGKFGNVARLSVLEKGEVVLDRANFCLPISGTFQMNTRDSTQSFFTNWTEKAEWEYKVDETGRLLPYFATYTMTGGDFRQFDKDPTIRFRKKFHSFDFSKKIEKDEFRIVRFGFQEPKPISSSINIAWILIPLGIGLFAFGLYLKRRLIG